MVERSRLEKVINYQFRSSDLLNIALTHRSVGHTNYERLEYLGDSILGFVVAKFLFLKFPEESEGRLSRMRSEVVQQKSLASVARGLGLGEYLLLGEGEKKSGGHRRDSILSDAYEAIIGAIFLDGDINQCEKYILATLEERLSCLSEDGIYKDSKSELQELLQKFSKPLPVYEVIEVSGPSHNQMFTVTCKVTSLDEDFMATGHSIKYAEQQSASLALQKMKNG